MKKKKISKKLDLKKKEISKLSGINGGVVPVRVPINAKTNDARWFSRVDTCLCMTIGECDTSQATCPV